MFATIMLSEGGVSPHIEEFLVPPKKKGGKGTDTQEM